MIKMNNQIVFKLEKLKDKVKNNRINNIKIILEMEQILIRMKFTSIKRIIFQVLTLIKDDVLAL